MRQRRARIAGRLIAAFAAAAAAAPQALAIQVQPAPCPEVITGEVRISPPDGNIGGLFGNFVDVSGAFAAVGATGDDDDGVFNSGAVYIHHRDATGAWIQEAKLLPAAAAVGDRFGNAVAISGDTVAVGAFGTTVGGLAFSGAVHVFRRDVAGNWNLEQFVTPIDPGPFVGPFGDQFGFAVELDGDRMVVGAPLDDDIASDSGAAYVFQRSGGVWTQTAKLVATDGAMLDSRFYGNDVGVRGDTIVVGISFDHTLGLAAGAAYVYDFNGVAFVETKIFASDARPHDRFGQHVGVTDGRLVVGAHGDDDTALGDQNLFKGAAYVFEKDAGGAWVQRAKLTDPNGMNQDNFGFAVAISGDTAIAGSVELPSVFGAAFVFRRNSSGVWKRLPELQASDTVAGDSFGVDVSASGSRILVGAFGKDVAAVNSGAAYFYDIVPNCTPPPAP